MQHCGQKVCSSGLCQVGHMETVLTFTFIYFYFKELSASKEDIAQINFNI